MKPGFIKGKGEAVNGITLEDLVKRQIVDEAILKVFGNIADTVLSPTAASGRWNS